MKPDTIAWYAEQLNITPAELDARMQRARERVHRDDVESISDGAPQIDVHHALRSMAPVGPGAGARACPVGGGRSQAPLYTLVVSLPFVRVWVAQREQWEAAERSVSRTRGRIRPVMWEMPVRLADAPPGAAPVGLSQRATGPASGSVPPHLPDGWMWTTVCEHDVPSEVAESVGRAVWAAVLQRAAA